MLRFLFSKTFIINLLIAMVIVIIFLYALFANLDDFTNHGETITTPDIRGVHITDVKEFLEGKNVRYKVMDSTYMPEKLPGTVVDQDPPAETKVKPNRNIYLSINTTVVPKTIMPDLNDVTLRQAISIIEGKGLEVGELIYRPDLAKNVVLEQQYNGRVIKPGKKLPKGSLIDLILGDGLSETKIRVPKLIGLTQDEALFVLHSDYLNVGAMIYTGKISDTSAVRVYKQIPEAVRNNKLSQGSSVDLFLKQ